MLDVENIFDGVTALRHKLHTIPEIAGREFETQKTIRGFLADLPLEVLPPFLETDTVAFLRGGKGEGPNVTLRADIDALPIEEQTGAPFASKNCGMMHACGHDMHISMLAGAAQILASCKDELCGSVRFVWQPGEECVAMGKQLVEAGAIDDPRPDRMTSIHMAPGVPLGTLALKYGPIMASSTHFKITVTGRSGHGSAPFKTSSPILAAAAMITDLQQIIPNRIDPQNSAVLSFGIFKAGEIENVIPDQAVFAGTIRALDTDTGRTVMEAVESICRAMAEAYRVKVDFDIHYAYRVTSNDKAQTDMAVRAAEEAGIPVQWMEKASMAAEDFSYFLDRAPGVYVRLGVGDLPPLHNSRFLPPDEVMKCGIRYLVAFTLDALKK